MSKRRTERSTDANDYQHVPRPVSAMSKSFADGSFIKPHSHPRDQLIYAVTGVMRVRTQTEAWIVPPDRAVYMPANTEHAITTHGLVTMSTIYIAPDAAPDLPRAPTVLEVAPLMRELVLGLIDEPVLYDEKGRAGALAALIFIEIKRARRLQLMIPMPRDPRLMRICKSLLDDPGSNRSLEVWAEASGVSPRTLARLFKDELSMGFSAWRQRVRFHNAIGAIMTGEPIAMVATQNGYRSASAFTAAFRQVLGQPPSAMAPKSRHG